MADKKRLIDANSIKYRNHTECHGHGLYFEETIAYKEDIDLLPTIDAVEVVRCEKCSHRADVTDNGNYLCNRKMLGLVRPDDFCSFGERRA